MPHVTLNVHDEPITIDFTILNFEDAVLEIDWTFKDRKPVSLTPEIEATFSEWWMELPSHLKDEYWADQLDAEASYYAELEGDREREERE